MDALTTLVSTHFWTFRQWRKTWMLILVWSGIYATLLYLKTTKGILMALYTPIRLCSRKSITCESYLFHNEVDSFGHAVGSNSYFWHKAMGGRGEDEPAPAYSSFLGALVLQPYKCWRNIVHSWTYTNNCQGSRLLRLRWSTLNRLASLYFILKWKITVIVLYQFPYAYYHRAKESSDYPIAERLILSYKILTFDCGFYCLSQVITKAFRVAFIIF